MVWRSQRSKDRLNASQLRQPSENPEGTYHQLTAELMNGVNRPDCIWVDANIYGTMRQPWPSRADSWAIVRKNSGDHQPPKALNREKLGNRRCIKIILQRR